MTEISDPDRLYPTPLVSVLMLAYNHERYVAQAIESVLEQVVDFDYEIVIGDDCSTDATCSVAASYQSRQPDRIKLLRRQKNVGVASNLARTYLACRGKFVFILEGDDYWRDPAKMAIQVAALQRNPNVAITYHDATAYCDDLPQEIHIGARTDLLPAALRKGQFINTLTAAFRSVITEFPGEFYLASVPDVFLWSLLGQHGGGLYIPEIKSAYYRVHDNGYYSSQSENRRSLMMIRTFTLMMLYYGRIGRVEEEENFRRKIVFFMLRSQGLKYWLGQAFKSVYSRTLGRFEKWFHALS